MKRLAATLLTILLYLTSSIAWSESISTSDLEKRSGIIYKKRSNIPFTGSVRGKSKDGYFFKKTYKNGQVVGPYESYLKTVNYGLEDHLKMENMKDVGNLIIQMVA